MITLNYTEDMNTSTIDTSLTSHCAMLDVTGKDYAKKIPNELKQASQWITWRYEDRDDKWTKVPYTPGSFVRDRASTTDPKTWSTFEKASDDAANRPELNGIGFVFTTADPFAGIDLDKCRDKDTGEIELWAQSIIDRVDSYTEISPSGTGVKIWVRATLPKGGRRKGQVEMYDEGRYFTVTGQHLSGMCSIFWSGVWLILGAAGHAA